MSALASRWNYYRRVISAYVLRRESQLTFWHEDPELNPDIRTDELGPYYMTFAQKADYPGLMQDGVPLLDYRGAIGPQHNPIAIAQYGLGNFNLYSRHGDRDRRARFLRIADWLLDNLEDNEQGIAVWNHHFDWEYRTTLRAPWYSGLAQGQGVSVLVRAYRDTQEERYLEASRRVFVAMTTPIDRGGVLYEDATGDKWIEEYVVDPPTHILNGFMWAAWGVYDLWLADRDDSVKAFFNDISHTIATNLERYDCGFWSLYELSGTRLKMLASPFYHRLHVVQLDVMSRLTGDDTFGSYARHWESYATRAVNRYRAMGRKALFKALYY